MLSRFCILFLTLLTGCQCTYRGERDLDTVIEEMNNLRIQLDGNKKFGCEFSDEHFTTTTKQDSIFDAVYGAPVQPLEVTLKALADILFIIKSYNNSDSVCGYQHDTMKPFVEFYDSYRDQYDENMFYLSSFFNEHQPSYLDSLPITPIVDLWDAMIRRDSTMYTDFCTVNHLYIATTDEGVDDTIMERIENLEENPKWFNHKTIMGVLRISVNGRLGFVVVHTPKGSEYIVSAVMEDGAPLIQNIMDDGTPLVPRGSDFYEARIFRTAFRNIDNPSFRLTRNKKFLIYTNPADETVTVSFVGRPFCSMIQSTTKSGLLSGELETIRRLKNGPTWASISMDVKPHDVNSEFRLFYKPDPSESPNATNLERVARVSDLQRITSGLHFEHAELTELFESVEFAINTRIPFVKNLARFLEYVGQSILGDENFMFELKNLQNEVNSQRNEYFVNNI